MSNGRPAGGLRIRRSAAQPSNIAPRVVLVEIQHVDGGYEERAADAMKRIEKHAAFQDGSVHLGAYREQRERRVLKREAVHIRVGFLWLIFVHATAADVEDVLLRQGGFDDEKA
ncbi:hypothetical protein MY11210_001326 [Beauveria gryllotalpidicola]